MTHLSTLLLSLGLASTALGSLRELPLPQAGARLMDQDRPSMSPSWQAFAREEGWQVADWDKHHAFPHRAFGPGLSLPGGPIKDGADLDHRLRAFLANHPDLLSGGPNGGPEQLKAAHLARHGDLWYALYRQSWQGHEVAESELLFRVKPDGRLVLMGSDLFPIIQAPEPTLGAREAEAAVRALAAPLALRGVQVEEDWVLLPLLGAKGFEHRPVWPCRVVTEDAEQVWRVFIDALTGEPRWAFNEVRHVTVQGQLMGIVEEEQPADADTPHPLQHLRLSLNGEEFHTNADGSFTHETNQTGPWLLEGGLYGRFANVDRQDGADGAFSLELAENGQTLTVGTSAAQLVELDAYHHTSRVHDFITNMDPGFTGLNEPLTVRVNIGQTCNAYWDGSSINFFQEGGGCPNTGRVAGVVYHEYGHGINDRQYLQGGAQWGMTNGAMHEGLADVTAIYLQNEHFVSPGWFIRELDNGNHYPESIQNEVHYDGLIIGGAMYDLKMALGLEAVTPLHHFARWGVPDDADLGRASFEYFLEILLLDDDDGDLGNLTPNFDAINTAFNAHGIGSDLTWMGTDFTLLEPPVINPPLQALPLSALLEAPAFVTPQAVRVHWWVAGGDTATVDLVDAGNGEWTGELPGQPWNTVVLFYAEVENEAGVELLSPPGAPGQVFRTRFVWNAGLAVDFEDVPGAEALNDVWQWGQPQDGPGAAFEGERCWGTNLGGNYPDMSISRLVVLEQDVEDEDQVIVSLRHWMAVEEGWDGVNVEMSLNGGDWQLITPLTGYDFTTPDNNALPFVPALTGFTNGWEELSFDLTELTHPGDRVALRLNLLTDTYVTEAGWYVDLLGYLGFLSPASIRHEPLRDTEDGSQASFPVEATVNQPGALTRFDLLWRVDGGSIQSLPMVAGDDSHVAVIPGPFWNQTIEYRLEAEGEGGFVGYLPEDPSAWLSFHVGTDQTPPLASFVEGPGDAAGWSALWPVVVEATDNLALPLEAVWVEWRSASGDWQHALDLALQEDGMWGGLLDFYEGNAVEGVQFRALARDASTQHWTGSSETRSVTLGQSQLLDNFEDPMLSHWSLQGVFTAQQSRVHGGSYALGTGATGFYDPLTSGLATLDYGLDLRHVTDPALVLWESWFLEQGDDEAWIEISTDGGEDWQQLLTRTGGRAWGETRLSLAAFVGEADVRLRVGFQADGDNNGLHIGYFLDDLSLLNNADTAVEEPLPMTQGFHLGQPWPNPFNPSCRVELSLATAGVVDLALFNVLGQEVRRIHQGPLAAGSHLFTVEGEGMAAGLYLLRASTGNGQETRRLLLMK